jgi:hypothetical protein
MWSIIGEDELRFFLRQVVGKRAVAIKIAIKHHLDTENGNIMVP